VLSPQICTRRFSSLWLFPAIGHQPSATHHPCPELSKIRAPPKDSTLFLVSSPTRTRSGTACCGRDLWIRATAAGAPPNNIYCRRAASLFRLRAVQLHPFPFVRSWTNTKSYWTRFCELGLPGPPPPQPPLLSPARVERATALFLVSTHQLNIVVDSSSQACLLDSLSRCFRQTCFDRPCNSYGPQCNRILANRFALALSQ
jgi:hypothetical protein